MGFDFDEILDLTANGFFQLFLLPQRFGTRGNLKRDLLQRLRHIFPGFDLHYEAPAQQITTTYIPSR